MDILDAVNELLHGEGVTMLGRDMLARISHEAGRRGR